MYDFLVSAMIKNDKFDDFLESEKDFDSAMIEIKELLNERNLIKYSELL